MSKLKEALQKRANLAAKFEIPYLSEEQLDALWEAIKELPEEEREAAREHFIDSHSWLKVTFSRLAEAEMGRADELARQAFPLGDEYKKLPEGERARLGNVYLAKRRDALWPMLLRSVVEGVEHVENENGGGMHWVKVEQKELLKLLGLIGLTEQAFFVNRYLEALAKDKEAREKDPESFR